MEKEVAEFEETIAAIESNECCQVFEADSTVSLQKAIFTLKRELAPLLENVKFRSVTDVNFSL